MHDIPNWLSNSFIYLSAAVLAVPLSKALGLGSIIGYLAAGMAIGPWGLRLVTNVEDILHFAEFGVVLMLFLVGLELEPRRLWALRRPIFGWGSAQVLGCAAALFGLACLAGVDWHVALVAALGLALSSTAIALQVMGERNLLPTSSGQAGFSMLLFQDVAAIPILALLPLLGGVDAATAHATTAAALLLVIGIAGLMQLVGLSMALGAFLAGVLLAESEYRRELETDLEPFKGLLLGLFFIAVGMSIDFDVLLRSPGTMALILLGFLACKAVVIWGLATVMKLPRQERPVFTLLLAQGGEFAFVVFQAAAGAKVFSAETASLLIGAVALSMLLGPLLLVGLDRYVLPRFTQQHKHRMEELSEPQEAPIILCGFGRYGQIIGRMINLQGITATVLDHDADTIESVRAFGFRVHYGDATRLDLLRTAGAAHAKVIVVAVDDVDQSLKIVDLVQAHFPHLTIVARARNVNHLYQLRDRGVPHIERELFDASMRSARSILESLGWPAHEARRSAMRFRQDNLDLMEQMYPHYKDRARMISVSKQGREQLVEQMARERAAQAERRPQSWED